MKSTKSTFLTKMFAIELLNGTLDSITSTTRFNRLFINRRLTFLAFISLFFVLANARFIDVYLLVRFCADFKCAVGEFYVVSGCIL